MSLLTFKFGGTSIGSPQALQQAADIVLTQAGMGHRIVVVVSAMNGVTDALIAGAYATAQKNANAYQTAANELRQRHQQTILTVLKAGVERDDLMNVVDQYLGEFAALCRGAHMLGAVTPRTMDSVSSLGEPISAHMLAALLRQRGARSEAVDATELILTDDTFQNAAPIMPSSRERTRYCLLPLLEQGIIPVVTGFRGATSDGVTTTLGRGGSDLSAAVLGSCLDATEVWTWTDVDGVMTADPHLVPHARVIPSLSYAEAAGLAYFGAKVLHPRTIRPLIQQSIPVWVKNTFNPTCPGTRITRETETLPGTAKAVTAIGELTLVTVEGTGMLGVPGVAARTFAAVASQKASILMISQASSEQSICFVIPTSTAPGVIHAVQEEMSLELQRGDIDRVWAQDDVVIVTCVGAGMRETPGVAARICVALAREGINIVAIAQGSSDCSVSIVVPADSATKAVKQIHREVILHEQDSSSSSGGNGHGGTAFCTTVGEPSLVRDRRAGSL